MSEQYHVVYSDGELYHSGVKGMKWGVRHYQNKDGSLTPAGKKRYRNNDGSLNDRGVEKYAKKGYAQDSLNKNKTAVGRTIDRYTGAHKTNASAKYEKSSKEANQQRAEKYLKDRDAASKVRAAKNKERAAKTVAKGAEVTSKLLLTSAVDDVFYGGAGKKIAKEAVVQTGRAAVTAYTMARGGYDIKWYDSNGRRVG